jgi:hypothetical protein
MKHRLPQSGMGFYAAVTSEADRKLFEFVAILAESVADKDLTNLEFLRLLMQDFSRHRELAK